MATESNATGFHPSAFSMSRHAISFQSSGAISNSSEMVPMVANSYFGVNNVGSGGMIYSAGAANTTSISHGGGLTQPGACSGTGSPPVSVSGSGSLLLDSVPGLKHDTGLAVEWSVDEQYKLEDGLKKFADEPSIMRYIKIAATLHNKTVRDVALRCRWMTRKRRKPEEHNPGKKVNSRKDKLVESSSKTSSTLPMGLGGFSSVIHQKDLTPFEVSGLSSNARHLLEQNTQAFNQITANLHTCKLQDNLDLFCHARNNITAILNNMGETPGIMSQMPPLPVSLDDDLANTILPSASQFTVTKPNCADTTALFLQPLMFGSGSSILLKQEPRC